jgi:O-methyltransferase
MWDALARIVIDRTRDWLANRNILLIRYSSGQRTKDVERVSRLKSERDLLLSHGEACQLMNAARATERVAGPAVEVGVFKGASARLLRDSIPVSKTLHLLDTFEGLPEVDAVFDHRFARGEFKTQYEEVSAYLSDLPNIRLHKGLFPAETGRSIEDLTFSFVHLDVDLYQGTLDSLNFFYPRMSRGGIIVSHDFRSADGVDRAFREFFAGKPEPVVELLGYQALVMKL